MPTSTLQTVIHTRVELMAIQRVKGPVDDMVGFFTLKSFLTAFPKACGSSNYSEN